MKTLIISLGIVSEQFQTSFQHNLIFNVKLNGNWRPWNFSKFDVSPVKPNVKHSNFKHFLKYENINNFAWNCFWAISKQFSTQFNFQCKIEG